MAVVARDQDVAETAAGFGAHIGPALVPTFVGVAPDGPAAAAGFLDGDVIVAVDGDSVAELSPRGVRILLANRPPGTTVTVTAARGAVRVSGDLVLTEGTGP